MDRHGTFSPVICCSGEATSPVMAGLQRQRSSSSELPLQRSLRGRFSNLATQPLQIFSLPLVDLAAVISQARRELKLRTGGYRETGASVVYGRIC